MRKQHYTEQTPVLVIALKAFLRPCVYGWKHCGQWMYVGCSTKGLSRLANHHAITPNDLDGRDELVTWHVADDSHAALFELEAALIKSLRPTLNNSGMAPTPNRARQRRETARLAARRRAAFKAEKAAIAQRRKFGMPIGESETDITECVGEATKA